MRFRNHRRLVAVLAGPIVVVSAVSVPNSASAHDGAGPIKHIVVIYEENHSFDNLFGGWEGVNGIHARRLRRTPRRSPGRLALPCLLQNDVNLTSPTRCRPPARAPTTATPFDSAIRQRAVPDRRLHQARRTRRAPRPASSPPNGVLKNGTGRCRAAAPRDLVHRFYQEQYQIDGGRQDRYVTGSDAIGLTMGPTTPGSCRSTGTCTRRAHPRYAHRRQLLPGGVRRFVPQPPVARRGARRRSSPGALARRQRQRPALRRRRERHADQLPALRLAGLRTAR